MSAATEKRAREEDAAEIIELRAARDRLVKLRDELRNRVIAVEHENVGLKQRQDALLFALCQATAACRAAQIDSKTLRAERAE